MGGDFRGEYPEDRRYDITIYQGSRFYLKATWKDKDGLVVPNTGYAARMHVRRELSDTAELLLEATDANGLIILGGADGVVEIDCPATVTEDVDKSGWYSLLMLPAASETLLTLLFWGQATRVPGVTE